MAMLGLSDLQLADATLNFDQHRLSTIAFTNSEGFDCTLAHWVGNSKL